MKSSSSVKSLIVALLAAMTFGAMAAQYVPSPPLSAVVKTAVGPVREGVSLELPIITWGGDIGTIHANGDAVNTAPGSIFAKVGLNFKLVREDVLVGQIEKYLSGQTPYLRGTAGMINMAADEIFKDGTELVGKYFNNPRDRGRFGKINLKKISSKLQGRL